MQINQVHYVTMQLYPCVMLNEKLQQCQAAIMLVLCVDKVQLRVILARTELAVSVGLQPVEMMY